MFAATRFRRGGIALFVMLLCACAPGAAWGAVPGGYAVQAIDNGPAPPAGDRLGSPVANVGDLDGDGKNDVAIGLPAANGGEGEVLVVSGATGAGIYRIAAPTEPTTSPAPARFGTSVAVLGQVLSCSPGAPGSDCSNKQPDTAGAPEFLVGATGADVNSDLGADQGRVYVIEGETGTIANRVMLAADDLPLSGKAEFGHSVLAVGDMDGDGKPDFGVGAPAYTETDTTYCEIMVCTEAGRVYVYSGADLLSNHATSPLQAPLLPLPNPFAAQDTASQRFGHTLAPLGDVGQCTSQAGGGLTCLELAGNNVPSNTPDGKADFLATAPMLDQGAAADAGAAFVLEGKTGLVIKRINAVDPQAGGRFGAFSVAPPAPGDLGGGPRPDVLVGAPDHGTGNAYLVDSDVTGTAALATLGDPAPVGGGGFGAATTALVTGEVAVGAPLGARPGSVRLFNGNGTLAQSICDPDGQPGGEFGRSIASLGDANGDGFDELAIGAPGHNGNSGRVYVLTSKGPAATGAPAECVSIGPGDAGAGGGDGTADGGAGDGPADEGEVVIARVLRRLTLKPNHSRVSRDATLRLRGRLTASANRRVCQRRQKIALQRRKGGKFQTFDVAVTRANGRFTTRAIAERTYTYRARVSQTARCMGAVSKTARVSVKRKRGSR